MVWKATYAKNDEESREGKKSNKKRACPDSAANTFIPTPRLGLIAPKGGGRTTSGGKTEVRKASERKAPTWEVVFGKKGRGFWACKRANDRDFHVDNTYACIVV